MNLYFNPTFASDEDHEDARRVLAEHVGEGEASKPSWLNRLVRSPDGSWRIRVAHALHDLRQPYLGDVYYDLPLLAVAPTQIMGDGVREYELAEGVALLRGPANPEIEIARRRQLIEAYEQERAAERAAEERRKEASRIASEAEGKRARELAIEFRHNDWYALPPERQVLTLAALALEDGATGAAFLRTLAAKVATNLPGIGPGLGGNRMTFPAPLRRWW